MISVFISHSHEDTELVKGIISLLRSALNLRANEIRATSVDGFRLPGGSNTIEQLRTEVQSARVLVGIVSRSSLKSAFVTFELGARWGTGKPMVPLLAHNMEVFSLPVPLSGINALSCKEPAQLHQFIVEMAAHLDLQLDSPAAYHKCIDEIVTLGSTKYAGFSESNAVPIGDLIDQKPPAADEASQSLSRGPYLGQAKLRQFEQYAHQKLRDGVPPAEVVKRLEDKGAPPRMARELTEEARRDVGK